MHPYFGGHCRVAKRGIMKESQSMSEPSIFTAEAAASALPADDFGLTNLLADFSWLDLQTSAHTPKGGVRGNVS
jgi:hypothetical protein